MKKKQLTDLERLAIRERPGGQPIMHQDWGKLLFMHWRMDEQHLRPLIPERLEIDTFDGSAWVAVTPFTMWDIRAFPPYLPPVPGLSSMHELNVRTYVHLDNVPGVWFFSLDANSTVAVTAARSLFRLPYFYADITREQQGQTTHYAASREAASGPHAEFGATWTVGDELKTAATGSLDFFLTERYCLYTADGDKLYRARIHHRPWPLRKVHVETYRSKMVEAAGLERPAGEPLLHHGGPVDVEVWSLEEV
jgi:uncharacterized protein